MSAMRSTNPWIAPSFDLKGESQDGQWRVLVHRHGPRDYRITLDERRDPYDTWCTVQRGKARTLRGAIRTARRVADALSTKQER